MYAQVPAGAISLEDDFFNSHFQKGRVPMVSGKVINLAPDEIFKTQVTYSLVTPFEQARVQIKRSCNLRPDGSFVLEIDYPFPYQQIWISVGELFYAGIYANTELNIELDAALLRPEEKYFNGPGIRYLGEDGPLNTYMNNKVLFKRQEWLQLREAKMKVRDLIGGKKISFPVYQRKYDSLYACFRAQDAEYIHQNPSPFSWLIENETASDYYSHLLVDYDNHKIPDELFSKIKKHKAYLISNSGMGFYNYLYGYMDFFSGYHRDATTRAVRKARVLDSLFTPSKSDFLKMKCSASNPKDQAKIIEILSPNLKTGWCGQVLQKEFVKMSANLAAINHTLGKSKAGNEKLGHFLGETPFGAKLYRADSLEANELLTNLKNMHSKKALFIDFWATWCGPCISQFPSSRKLHDQTKNLSVEFVYLCTTSGVDFDKWKLLIADNELAGIHVLVNKDRVDRLMEMFSVNGFPSYVFIDQNGVFKPGAAKRPSEMTAEIMAELLKK